ncbi:MAG: tetratricopeptide repeat protein [Bacteroidales bacterium]|nr:tetratricopeptide repeat protein [Bacteroidales bacterium]
MMKYFAILLLVLFPLSVFARHAELFDSANIAYSEKKYEQAALKYEAIILSGYESYEIYYNLGNSYFKLKNLPKAILNYERALLLKPNDEDIKYNLELANANTIDKLEAIPPLFFIVWLNNLAQLTHSNKWALISIICFVVFLILFLVYLFTKKISIKKVSFWVGIITLIISLTSFSLSSRNRNLYLKNNAAIVLAPSVTAKSTPDDTGTDLFVVHEGTKVFVTDKLDIWVEIKLSDGNKGWIKELFIEKIVRDFIID